MAGFSRPARLEKADVTAGFDSGATELDEWLVKFAWENQKANNATTFVSQADGRIAGYYAVTVASIAKANAPNFLTKGSPNQIGCLLLARLAVDRSTQGSGLGTALLTDCLGRTAQLAGQVGVKALLVHCRDEAGRSFYLDRADFHASPVDRMQLFLPVKWILNQLQQR